MIAMNGRQGSGGSTSGGVAGGIRRSVATHANYEPEGRNSHESSSTSSSIHSEEEDGGDGEGFLQEVNMTWLDRYWSKQRRSTSAKQSVASRLQSKQKHPLSSATLPTATDSSHAVIRRKQVIGSIPLATLMEEESQKRDDFQVHLQSAYGLGVDWSIDRDSSRVIVHNFSSLVNDTTGQCYVVGAAEACGLIAPGDELLRVNDCWLKRLDLMQIRDMVMKIDMLAKVKSISFSHKVFVWIIEIVFV